MSVHLWSYSGLDNVFRHSGISVHDASALLPLGEAVALLGRGLRIQHLADYVRGLAVQDHCKRLGVGAWLADVDQIWIRPFGFCPSKSGHVFSSMYARQNTIRGPDGDAMHWKVHWVKVPEERTHFSNAPMAIPPGSEVLDSSLTAMRTLFATRQDLSSLNYTAIVTIYLESIRASGLLLDIMDPSVFSPVPHFASGCHVFGTSWPSRQSSGVELPGLEEILSRSCVVSQTFLSWSKEADLDGRVIKGGSLYARLAQQLRLPSLQGMTLGQISIQYFPENLQQPIQATAPENPQQPIQATAGFDPSGSRPCGSRPSRRTSHAVTLRRMNGKQALPAAYGRFCPALAFRVVATRIRPNMLDWNEFLPLVATSRRAVPPQHQAHDRMLFGVERMLRLRCQFVRTRVSLPDALSVWSCALALWRSYRVSQAFAPVQVVEARSAVFVDSLLSVAAAQSPGHERRSGLRPALRDEHHDQQHFDEVCVKLLLHISSL